MEGGAQRFPRIRWALSHAGGAVPYVAYRITGLLGDGPGGPPAIRPVPWEMLGRLYYDTALSPVRPAMQSLLEVAPLSNVLFGTGRSQTSSTRRPATSSPS